MKKVPTPGENPRNRKYARLRAKRGGFKSKRAEARAKRKAKAQPTPAVTRGD